MNVKIDLDMLNRAYPTYSIEKNLCHSAASDFGNYKTFPKIIPKVFQTKTYNSWDSLVVTHPTMY